MGSSIMTADAYNQDHLKQIAKGQRRCSGFDLYGANMSGASLVGIDLSRANLTEPISQRPS